MSGPKNVFYSTILNVITVAFPIIITPYTARVLGVVNMGVVTFASTFASYFLLFIMLGIPTYGVREIAKHRNNPLERSKIFSELFSVTIVSSIICSVIYVVTVFSIPILREDWPFLMVAGLQLLFGAFNIEWYLAGREDLRFITIRSVAVKVVCVAAIFLFVRQRDDLIIYLIINIVANVLGQMWTFFHVVMGDVKLVWRALNVRRHLRPVSILFVSGVAISVYTMLDTLMLRFLSDYEQVGFYGSAIKLSRMVLPFIVSASIVAVPKISRFFAEGNTEALADVSGRSFGFMSLLAPALTIGTMVIAPSFVPFFFGQEYVGAITPMIIVSSVMLLVGITNFYGGQVLIATGRDKQFMYGVIVGMVVNFVLNLFFIPLWGAVGAAWATVAAELAVAIAIITMALRCVPEIRPSYRTMIMSVVCSLPMFVYGWLAGLFFDSAMVSTLFIFGASIITFVVLEVFVVRDVIAREILERVIKNLRTIGR